MQAFLARNARTVVVAVLAAVVASVATAGAASLITGKQIKDGSISAKDLSKAVRAQLKQARVPGPKGDPGPLGAKGDPGAKGDAGPSAAFRATQSGTATVLTTLTKLATVTLPEAGNYVVNAQLFAVPGGAVVDGRDEISCGVVGSTDSVVASLRSLVAAPTETTLYTVIGAGTLPAGSTSLYCNAFASGGLDPINASGGLVTLTRVATLEGT